MVVSLLSYFYRISDITVAGMYITLLKALLDVGKPLYQLYSRFFIIFIICF